MDFHDIYFHLKETYGNVHVEANFDGNDWFFHDGKLIAIFNETTGEFKEVA